MGGDIKPRKKPGAGGGPDEGVGGPSELDPDTRSFLFSTVSDFLRGKHGDDPSVALHALTNGEVGNPPPGAGLAGMTVAGAPPAEAPKLPGATPGKQIGPASSVGLGLASSVLPGLTQKATQAAVTKLGGSKGASGVAGGVAGGVANVGIPLAVQAAQGKPITGADVGGAVTQQVASITGNTLNAATAGIPIAGPLLSAGAQLGTQAAKGEPITGEDVGGAVGGAGLGAAGGAAGGAIAGSVVPGIGTVIGAIVGGLVGGFAGQQGGSAIGRAAGGGKARLAGAQNTAAPFGKRYQPGSSPF